MDGGVSHAPRRLYQNYAEIFEECLPFYISIGMSPAEYWNGDAFLTRSYRKAFKMKQESVNHEAWLHGLYVYDAMMSALTHLSDRKDLHQNYTAKPYSFTPEMVEKEKEEKKIEAEAQAEVWMKSWVAATQKMFKE